MGQAQEDYNPQADQPGYSNQPAADSYQEPASSGVDAQNTYQAPSQSSGRVDGIGLPHKASPEDNKLSFGDRMTVAKAGLKSLAEDNPEPLIQAAIEDPELARKVLADGLNNPVSKQVWGAVEKNPVSGRLFKAVDPRNWSLSKKRSDVNSPLDDPIIEQNKQAGDAVPVPGAINPYRQVNANPNQDGGLKLSIPGLNRLKGNPGAQDSSKAAQNPLQAAGNPFSNTSQGNGNSPLQKAGQAFNGVLGGKSGSQGGKTSPQNAAAKKEMQKIKDEALVMAAAAILPGVGAALAKGAMWVRDHRREVTAVAVMIISIIALSFMSFAYGSDDFGNIPTEVAGVAPFGGATYCQEMQDALSVNGKRIELSGTSGKWSSEKALLPNGHIVGSDGVVSGGTVALWQYIDKIKPTVNSDPAVALDLIQKYYVTARWPYIAMTFGSYQIIDNKDPDLKTSTKVWKGLPSPQDYAGKRIIVYNPKTGKAVVGIAMEHGPAPWTGTKKGDGQQELWNQGADTRVLLNSATGNNIYYRIKDPAGYAGRVVGGPPTIAQKIGASSDTPVVYGFAVDQTLAPGTEVPCTPVGNNASGTDQTGTFLKNTSTEVLLNDPAVQQSESTNCGVASESSIILNYNKGPSDSGLFTYGANDTSVTTKGKCYPVSVLNQYTGKTDWISIDNAKSSSNGKEKVVSAIKESIRGGDPVMVYGLPGAFYNNQHIFVIVGFNDDKGTFYVNSSSGPDDKVGARTDTINGITLTQDRIFNYLDTDGNDGANSRSMMIRKVYADKYGIK